MNSTKVAPGAQHPARFGDGVDRALDVLEDQAGEGGVESFHRETARPSP